MEMNLKELLDILIKKDPNEIIRIQDIYSEEILESKVKNVIHWAKSLNTNLNDECKFIFK